MEPKSKVKLGAGVMILLAVICFVPIYAGATGSGYGKSTGSGYGEWGMGASGGGRGHKGFDRPGHHRQFSGIWRNPQMIEKLELTKEQVSQLRDLDFAHREKCLALDAQLDRLHLKMEKAFSAEAVDSTAVLETAQSIADVKGKLMVQNVESRLAVGEILTADQIDELKLCTQNYKKKGKKNRKQGRKQKSGRQMMANPDEESSGE